MEDTHYEVKDGRHPSEQHRGEDQQLEELAKRMYDGIRVEDRRHRFTTYPKCFIGSEAVDWLLAEGYATDISDAVALGSLLHEQEYFHHVTNDHGFKNEYLFYRFKQDEPNHGKKVKKADGRVISWQNFVSAYMGADPGASSLQSNFFEEAHEDNATIVSDLEVYPLDKWNVELLDNVHPPLWQEPHGEDVYNLVVIGAGTGGLVSAAGSAGLGAKVALIEAKLMGGDCLNVGCVPSKALIKCATVAHTFIHKASDYGVVLDGTATVDFGAVMERMRRLRASISHHDSAERFSGLGVDVFLGHGQFTGPNTVLVNGKTLTFRKAVIATGGSPTVPHVPGFDEAGVYTNQTIFNLTKLPPRLAVIGAGPISLELAQAMRRFGSEVTVFVRGSTILPKEDEDAADVVLSALTNDGIRFVFNCVIDRVQTSPCPNNDGAFPNHTITYSTTADTAGLSYDSADGVGSLVVSAILVATGRKPNVLGMGLEAAGVEYSATLGIRVSDTLQTTNHNIFAVGDCCTKFQFTHVADFMARTVIRNALFFGSSRFSSLLIPWVTYTEPEVSHVGYNPHDMEEQGIAFNTITKHFQDNDRAIVEGSTLGFVKVHVRMGSDEILGATIVGEGAGDMISEVSVAIAHKIGLGAIASVIHPYPTRAEAVRQCGDLHNRTRLTPTVKALFQTLLTITR